MAIVDLPNGTALDTKRIMACHYQRAFTRDITVPLPEDDSPPKIATESKLFVQYRDANNTERKTTLTGHLADQVNELVRNRQ